MYLLPFQNINYFRDEDTIWRWNRTDVSQFDTANVIWFNAANDSPNTGSVVIEAVESGQTGRNILKITATNLSGGFIIPIIQDLTQTRYHIFSKQLSGTNNTARYLTGLFLQDSDLGMGFVHKRSNGVTTEVEFLAVESGSQSQTFAAGDIDMASDTHNSTGLYNHFFVDKRPELLGVEDFTYSIGHYVFGNQQSDFYGISSISASFTFDDGFTDELGNATDLNKVGLGIVNDSAPIAEIIFYVEDFAVIKHPMDRITS